MIKTIGVNRVMRRQVGMVRRFQAMRRMMGMFTVWKRSREENGVRPAPLPTITNVVYANASHHKKQMASNDLLQIGLIQFDPDPVKTMSKNSIEKNATWFS